MSTAFDFDGLQESIVDDDGDDGDCVDDECDVLCDGERQLADNENENDNEDDDECDDDFDDRFSALRSALIRESSQRSEEEVDAIVQYVDTIGACRHFDHMTRRRLARSFVLAEIENEGTKVLTSGERLDAFCVVACGSLRHTMPDGVVRVLCAGDEFGATEEERRHALVGEMSTAEQFVWVLCVPHCAFDAIVNSILPFAHIRDSLNGNVIEVRTNDNELIRAMRRQLWTLLVNSTSDDCCGDDHFIEDFLLTYRIWGITEDDNDNSESEVKNNNNDNEDNKIETETNHNNNDVMTQLMSKIVNAMQMQTNSIERHIRVVLLWIESHFGDFHVNDRRHRMCHLLSQFECQLKCRHEYKYHLKLFHSIVSAKSKERNVTLTRSDKNEMIPFTIVGGYEVGSSLFICDVHCEYDDQLRNGDRIVTINGIDCNVCVTVSRATQLLTISSHVSLVVRFDPNAFNALKEGRTGRARDERERKRGSNGNNNNCVLSQQNSPLSTSLSTTSHSSHLPKKWTFANASFAFAKLFTAMTTNTNNNNERIKNTNGMTTQTVVDGDGDCITIQTHSSHHNSIRIDSPEVIKVWHENDFRFLPIRRQTTARELVMLSMREFCLHLDSSLSSRDFALYEVKVMPTTRDSAVRRLADTHSQLTTSHSLSLHSRLYLCCVSSSSKLSSALASHDSSIVNDILRQHPNPLSLLTCDANSVANELTRRDFKLFAQIESQQFIYDLMRNNNNNNNNNCNERTKELNEFENVSNREMFWTIGECLRQKSLNKRVKIVKQFIKIAAVCRSLHNYNSLFAILSGLSHASLHRLKSTWDRIPAKHLKQLKQLQSLMDPSRNMFAYREELSKCSHCRPLVPFFPLVKKDLAFIHLANANQIDDMINWEKMTLLGRAVRQIVSFAAIQHNTTQQHNYYNFCDDLHTTNAIHSIFNTNSNVLSDSQYKRIWSESQMTKRVQRYLDESFECISMNETDLMRMSMECEAPPTPTSLATPTASSLTSRSSITSSSLTGGHPSPTLSSVSSVDSQSSSSVSLASRSHSQSHHNNRNRIHTLRFGAQSPQQLRKLLALSTDITPHNHNHSHTHSYSQHYNSSNCHHFNVAPNCLPNSSHSSSRLRSLSVSDCRHVSSASSSAMSSASLQSSSSSTNHSLLLSQRMTSHSNNCHHRTTQLTTLPIESSSVTSLRRLEHLTRFRRPPPDYEQTMKALTGRQTTQTTTMTTTTTATTTANAKTSQRGKDSKEHVV